MPDTVHHPCGANATFLLLLLFLLPAPCAPNRQPWESVQSLIKREVRGNGRLRGRSSVFPPKGLELPHARRAAHPRSRGPRQRGHAPAVWEVPPPRRKDTLPPGEDREVTVPRSL